jgi:hypothetical protein
MVLVPFVHRTSFRATGTISIGTVQEPRIVFRSSDLCSCTFLFETNNFSLGSVLLSFLVSEAQEPPLSRLELRAIYRNFYLTKISSWSQGISVKTGLSVLQLQANIHRFTSSIIPCKHRKHFLLCAIYKATIQFL